MSADVASGTSDSTEHFWSLDGATLLVRLGTTRRGLSSDESAARLRRHGRNELVNLRRTPAWRLLLAQFQSPLVLILVFAALVSGLLSDWKDAAVVGAILAAGAGLGFWREHGASRALEKLLERVTWRTRVLRDGVEQAVAAKEIVPGDIVVLSAGSLVPGDGVLLAAEDLFVSQAMLTGETFPVARRPGLSRDDAPLGARENAVFFGTSVRSGNGLLLVVRTGRATVFGGIAQKLLLRPPETEFDRGLRQFGSFLTKSMLAMTLLVFAINLLLHRPVAESLLFSVALAVGLAPELLPAILSVNLARSAEAMARSGVIVKHLNAIENLGSMDVLCTDKTGTLTEGDVRVHGAWDPAGVAAPTILAEAALNARLQAGIRNPLDEAILLAASSPGEPSVEKLGEIPYDFVRKRVSVALRGKADGDVARIISKGAVPAMLPCCSRLSTGAVIDDALRERLQERVDAWGGEGLRVLAVASRALDAGEHLSHDAEANLVLLGFLTFFDPPKAGVKEVVASLRSQGVQLKVITGDARAVAQHVATAVGLEEGGVLSGSDLDALHDEGLWHAAERTTLFVEVDPNQKERIILALQKTRHVVGYLGDGINDAPALHAADVGISVDSAVDVAKEAADLVLTDRDLDVLRRGIISGRKTFANTLKYVLTTMSANLGNMLSMALSSAFLPFLPLTATQILLNNFLSDAPALALASDDVDHELIEKPRRWDMKFIQRYMLEFGLLSSLFDFATFGVLIAIYHEAPEGFRTGWFVESLLTELVIALVVRTRRPFWRSMPGRGLWISTLIVTVVTLALPYIAPGRFFGLVPLPASVMAALIGITLAYVAAAELLKRYFYRDARVTSRRARAGAA